MALITRYAANVRLDLLSRSCDVVMIAAMLGGCGHLQSPLHPDLPPVSALDVPQLETARYVAVVDHAPPLSVAMWLELERGAYQCGHALADLDRTDRAEDPACPNAIVNALRAAPSHGLVVVDANGTHILTDKNLAAFVGGIDSPQKALLAALVHGCGLSWVEKKGENGVGSATAGFVRSVPGGYEVLGGTTETRPLPGEPTCGASDEDVPVKQTTRSVQIAWRVDHAGNATRGEERLLSEETITQSLDCHVR